MPGVRIASLVLTAVLLATACGPNETREPGTTGRPTATAPPTPSSTATRIPRVELEHVTDLEQPVAMAVRSGDPSLYFAEKVGRIVALREGGVLDVVLDLTREVSLGSEQGLLGLTFSPNGRFLYVNFTDVQGDTRVVEWRFGDRGVRLDSRREVLFVDQPFSNHNGGNLVFGPDGYLYIGLGDGGSGGDPNGNGQSLSTLLGKMLRISPRPAGSEPYGIPSDNPFVDTREPDPRSGHTACGTRGVTRSTGRPPICGSATSDRTHGRRSTSNPPGRPEG